MRPAASRLAGVLALVPVLAMASSHPPLSRTTPDDVTADGIPVLQLQPGPITHEGGVTWISELRTTLHQPRHEATDGARIYFAVSKAAGTFHDVLIRDGHVETDVLQGLTGAAAHPGGCAAARAGRVVLSAPGVAGARPANQLAWVIAPDGATTALSAPPMATTGDECRAWMDPDGRFTVGTFRLATWDGARWDVDRGWLPLRTHMASTRGPRFCFSNCNRQERSDEATRIATLLRDAMRCRDVRFHVFDRWVVGECRRQHTLARLELGKARPQVVEGLPETRARHGDIVAMTTDGHVVVALEYGMRRYVVWKSGARRLSPVRTLADDELLATASPTLLVRGLPPRVPEGTVAATLLGERIAFGAAGSTFGYRSLRRGLPARHAQVARARAVLPRAKRLVVAHEAVVDLECGAYVRSPLGWEGENMSDWTPPTLPALHRAAVHDPPGCQPLAEVVSVPGATDLLLARTPDGELLAAWLPPPLPLPTGRSHLTPTPEPPRAPVVQSPRPGAGWTRVGRADSLSGAPGLPPPGLDTAIDSHSWQAGGAAVVRADGATVLVTPTAAVAVPAAATPLAILQHAPGLYGALGSRLLVCDATTCRVHAPGPTPELVALVPRQGRTVVLGYADGRTGLYELPAAGGETVPTHPLADALRRVLETRPR